MQARNRGRDGQRKGRKTDAVENQRMSHERNVTVNVKNSLSLGKLVWRLGVLGHSAGGAGLQFNREDFGLEFF
jgi:hypothetical protein